MVLLENEILSVAISSQGGALRSVRSKENGIEYLWQGDRTYWGGQAPNLFPFVGRLYQEQYTYNGTAYPMKCHGFLSKMSMMSEQYSQEHCVFTLTDTPQTFSIYPFHFSLLLSYHLSGRQLKIAFQVQNLGDNTLFYGMGGHPGFFVPLEDGLRFEDYSIHFPEKCQVQMVEFSPGVLTLGKKPYPLKNDSELPLTHDLFQQDALVFTDCPHQVTLASSKGNHGVTVRFPDMPYIGLWQIREKNAPYLCIEPWSACPGRDGVIEDIAHMADMAAVAPGQAATNSWSIEIF